MSAVTANFTVAPVDLTFVVDNNNINFTPNAISLGIYTSNYSGIAIGLNANIANVHISDGINGYVLQTDGLGNLTWTAQTGNGGGGNGTPSGANSQVQFNDAGLFGGNSGFTFNKTTGVLTANGAGLSQLVGANVTGTVPLATTAGTVSTAAQGNITSVGTLTSLAVTGNISAGNVSATTFTGALTGNATTAGTVTTAAQPNITSVGTLSNLNVTNYANANIVNGNTVLATISANIANVNFSAGTITTTGLLGNITGANVIDCQTLKAVNLNVPQGYNPNATTGGNVTIQYKLPIVINGNTYYIGLTSSI